MLLHKLSLNRHLELLPKLSKTYKPSTIAKSWNINTKTVCRWIDLGLLNAIALPCDNNNIKKKYSITFEDLKEFLEKYGDLKNDY